jgi:uncharacterized membrane protein
MWPSLFGPGWGWGILVALVFLSVIVAVLGLLFVLLNGRRETAKPFDMLWHRFEEGDLTREEYQRFRRKGDPTRPAGGAGT